MTQQTKPKRLHFAANEYGIGWIDVDMSKWQIVDACAAGRHLVDRACRLAQKGTRLEYRSAGGYVQINADIEMVGLFMQDTVSILIMRYNHNPLIPLQMVADDYLPGLKWQTIKERARVQDLPFPVVVSKDKRPTYHVSVRALAAWIDKVSAEANQDHLAMHA